VFQWQTFVHMVMNLQFKGCEFYDELSISQRALWTKVLAGYLFACGPARSKGEVTVAVSLCVRSRHVFSARPTYSRQTCSVPM
jgi:hypothetical protein